MPSAGPTRRRPRRRLALGAVVAMLALGACAPAWCFDPTLRFGGTLVVDAEARVVRLPADRGAGSVVVRPAAGPAFEVPAGQLPPPGACRAWTPEAPAGRQQPPGPCPDVERDLPPGAFLIVG
jgi:hypothetical protein